MSTLKIGDQSQVPTQEVVDRYHHQRLEQLDFYEYTFIHEPFTTNLLQGMRDLQCVFLIRDPRDIIISYYFRLYGNRYREEMPSPALKERRLLDMLDGSTLLIPNYLMIWPSIQTIVHNFIEAMQHPHIFVIKFEDIHHYPLETYTKLLEWLQLKEDPFLRITDAGILAALQLSSFEYQTGGKAQRGEDNKALVMVNGSSTSCRKGVVGDWKNHFTPAIIHKFKTLTGNGLIQLGYETRLDW